MKPAAGDDAYYPALTGLRALAAFAVFGFHHRGMPWSGVPVLDAFGRAVLSEMHIGVSVFFTLSGFLITRRYAGVRFDRDAWRGYLLRRAVRILPVYAFLLTLTFAVGYFDGGRVLGRWLGLYLLNLTLLKGLVERWFLTGIGPAWSLTVEEGFYLLAPLVFGLGGRFGPARAWPLLALALAATGLGLYALLPALGSPMFVLKATIFGRLTEFLLGAAFAWYGPRLPALRGLTSFAVLALATVLALMVGLQTLAQVGVSIVSYRGVLLNNLLLPGATGLLIHGLATERTLLARVLGSRPGQLLGRASYSFYLLHMGLLAQVLKPGLWRGLPGGWSTAALFGLLVLASVLLYLGLEKPVHHWLRQRLGLDRPASVSPPSLPRG